MQNEELAANLRLPLARRVYSQAGLSWRRTEPLTGGELNLRSWWPEARLGYLVHPWLRMEAFYAGTYQTIDQPGGVLNRSQIGFQIITTKPLRVR
jgi:hypothetical protein